MEGHILIWSIVATVVLVPTIGWLINKLYQSFRENQKERIKNQTDFFELQFATINKSHEKTSDKLDGIQDTITNVSQKLSDIEKEKVGWEEFKSEKKGMKDDRDTKIELAIFQHKEKDHE